MALDPGYAPERLERLLLSLYYAMIGNSWPDLDRGGRRARIILTFPENGRFTNAGCVRSRPGLTWLAWISLLLSTHMSRAKASLAWGFYGSG